MIERSGSGTLILSYTRPTSEACKANGGTPGTDNGYSSVLCGNKNSRYNRKRIQLVTETSIAADVTGSGYN